VGFGSVLFPTGTYAVTRTARGVLALGRYTAGAVTTVQIVADVQHVSGDMLRDLPEGVRTEEVRIVYTTTQLYAQDTTHDPDVIAIDGDTWRVFRVDRFRVFANRFRALVQRVRV
jgi:spermidine synthase